MSTTVLVTGASGVFGAHCAKKLLSLGHDVVSIAHDEHPYDTALLLGIRDKITWARGSILDENFVKRVIADYSVSTVFHLAALPLVQVATRTTVPIFEANFLGTIHLLESIKENFWAGKTIKFVYVSTDKTYGSAGNQPYTEDMPLNALAVYDCSKAAADMAVRTYAACGFIPSTVVARPCNIIAAGDLNFGRLLPRMIVPCLRGERPFIYKTTYYREFIAVEDAVEALLTLHGFLGSHHELVHGQAFNIGSGEQKSLEQVVNTVLKHFPGIEPEWIKPPALTRVEIPFQLLDTTKMMKTTGWRPLISFEATVERTINWWRDIWSSLPLGIRARRIVDWHG